MQYFVTCGFDKTFSGNSNENFIAWRKSLLKYAKFISMPDDKLIEYIACLLHGRALRFYETLPTETTSNLNKFLNALQNRSVNGLPYVLITQASLKDISN